MPNIAIIRSNNDIKYPATITDAVIHLNNQKDLKTIIEELYQGSFKGTVNEGSEISSLRDYKKGWYWLVNTEGRYVGQDCEAGDMIYCIKDFNVLYRITDFEVIQGNLKPIQREDIDNLFNDF